MKSDPTKKTLIIGMTSDKAEVMFRKPMGVIGIRTVIGTWPKQEKADYTPLRDADLALMASLRSDFLFIKSGIEQLQITLQKIDDKPIAHATKIYDLGIESVSLKSPLDITIEKYDDECIASVPELETFGSGTTESEAIMELKREIISLYNDLSSTNPNELGSLPKMWLRILNMIIGK